MGLLENKSCAIFLCDTRTFDPNRASFIPQVLDMIRRKDEQGRTIVMAAASSGDQNTIKEVTSFVVDKLDDEEVINVLPYLLLFTILYLVRY